MRTVAITILLTIAFQAGAQSVLQGESLRDDSDQGQRVNNEPISISGDFQKRKLTRTEKMKLIRVKLEKRNELLVKREIERMRFRQEMKLSKRIQQAFQKSMNNLNQM